MGQCGAGSTSRLIQPVVPLGVPLLDKMETVSKDIYRAKGVVLADEVQGSCSIVKKFSLGRLQ